MGKLWCSGSIATLDTRLVAGQDSFMYVLVSDRSCQTRPFVKGGHHGTPDFAWDSPLGRRGVDHRRAPVLIVLLVPQKQFVSGLTMGPTKG